MIPYNITVNEDGKEFITAFTLSQGKPLSIPYDHINFQEIKDYLESEGDDEAHIIELAEVKQGIERKFNSRLRISGDQFFFDGVEIHNKVCDIIFEYIQNNRPIDRLVNFLVKLMDNPSKRSVDLAWEYIARYKMPITENGNFLSMKAVNNNFTDKHSGSINNSVGQVVKMPRNQISDDPNHPCHVGYHCGYIDYVRGFGRGNDQIILLEVNPKNIVCVPYDYSMQKMRVCEYKVIKSLGTHDMFFANEREDFSSNDSSMIQDDYKYEPEDEDDDNLRECGCHEDNYCSECGECDYCCECGCE